MVRSAFSGPARCPSRYESRLGRGLARVFFLPIFVLLFGALSPFAAAADVLVSNIGQSTNGGTGSTPNAMGFTTGSAASGYFLENIEVEVEVTASPSTSITQDIANIRAQLWSDSNGEPDSKLVDLAVPSSITTGNVAFTAPPGTRLEANKKYHFVFFYIADNPRRVGVKWTPSNNEDAGAALGWSIANNGHYESVLSKSNEVFSWISGLKMKIRVNGSTRSKPTRLSVTEGNARLDLSWTAPSGTVTGYDVHYTSAAAGTVADGAAASGADPATAWVDAGHTGTTTTQAITGLSNGTAYRVRVRAKNASGNGVWVHGTGTPTLPAPPNLQVTPGDGLLTASWSAPAGVDVARYEVQIKLESASGWPNDNDHTDVTSFTSQTFLNLTNNSRYQVRVRTVETGEGALSDWSAPVGATPEPAPAAPTNLVPTPGNARLDLRWTAPSGTLTGYDVHYTSAAAGTVAADAAASGADPATAWVAVNRTGTTPTQAITGLTNGTAYRVRVRAKNASGNGAWARGTGTPQAPAPATPDEPSNLTPSFGGATIPDQSWTEGKQVETLTLPAATGGDGDLAYSLTPALPSGLTFDATTRQVTGTPETPQEAVTYTYTATDTDGDTDELGFTITVEENLIPSFGDAAIPDQSWMEGRVIETLTLPVATGGNGELTYSLTPAVPAGLTLAAATRMLSGTPTRAQAARGYTWTVTDADGDTDTVSFTITVEAALAQEVQAWLTRFGRTVGQQAVDAIAARRSAARTPGFSGTFAGQALPTVAGSGDDETREAGDGPAMQPEIGHRPVIDRLRDWLSGDREAGQVTQSTTTTALGMEQVLAGTAFALTQDTDNGASLGLWGAGAYAGFSGREGGLSVEGDVSSFMLGTDWARGDHLLGLMLAHSRGSGSYSSSDGAGEIESRLTSLVPYANWDVSERVSVWGAVGLGRGDMTLRPEDGAVLSTDIDWRMAAAGADGSLGHVAALGGADLRWTADALWTRTTSEGRAGLVAVSGDTTRLRFGVETGWTRVLSSGAVLSPRLEMAARHDGGDAETGFGVEIGGGLDWFDPVRGLEVGVTGRRLVLHEQDGFEDWGVALTMSYDPTPDTKRGFSAGVSRSLGGASSGGMAALLGPQTFPTATGSEAGGTWSAEMAYGVSRGRGMVASPYTRLSGGGGAEQARLGYRVEPDAAHAADMNLDLWLQPGTANTGETAGGGLNWRW